MRTLLGIAILTIAFLPSGVYQARRTIFERVYTIGVDEAPPLAEIGPGGVPAGLAVEILNEAARRRNIPLRWVQLPGINPDDALRSGVLDLWPVVGITERRRSLFHLSKPWIMNTFALIERQISDERTAGEIAGHRVAFSGFQMATQLALKHLPGAILVPKTSRAGILDAVCRGEADAGFEEASYLNYLLLNPPKACQGVPLKVNMVSGAIGEGAIGASLSAARVAEELRKEITEMARDGFLSRTLDRTPSFLASETRSIHDLQAAARARERLTYAFWLAVLFAAFLAWQMKRAAAGQRAAQEADDAKSEFLANMSHEIRTPLHGVIGLLDLAVAGETDPAKRQHLLLAKRSAEALMSVTNDILDLAKVRANQLVIVFGEFNLRETLEALVLTLAPPAERKVKLQLEYAEGLPSDFRGDVARVRQILTNLIGNAVKFTDEGSVTVVVDWSNPGAEDSHVRFEVQDTGIGIPLNEHENLFKKFSQVDPSSTRRRGGAGLGLAISKQIAELMGGRIGVMNREPVGTTFWLELPLTAVPPEKTPAQSTGAALVITDPPVGRRRRILVAEDNHVNQVVLTRSLQRLGYEVEIAHNGAEAVEHWKSGPQYDAILMDCQMPEMDGYEAARIIRQHQGGAGRIPIIALTAHAMSGDEARCLAAGMDVYMSKPFHIADLQRTLRQFENAAGCGGQ